MKLSDFVFKYIASKGIDTVFTVTGGGCMHLTDSLGKTAGLQYICNHHEQASAIAAEAYFRTSGLPGCILVTTGPGGVNALTGVLCAYQDSIPMIVISGQVPVNQMSIGTGCRQIGQQEFDIVSTVKIMTKYAVTITDKDSILYHLGKAYYTAITGRPGPVWIDIPLDIQASDIDANALKPYTIPSTLDVYSLYNKWKLLRLQKLLNNSTRPIVVIGNGIKASGTIFELQQFLKKTKFPIMSGPHSAIDIINNDYQHYLGIFGLLGHQSSNGIIQRSDLVISLGSRLNPKMIGYNSKKFAPNATKVIIDIDKNELKKLKFDKSLKWNIDLKDFFILSKNLKTRPHNISVWNAVNKQKRKSEVFVKPKHWLLKDYVSTYVFSKELERFLKDDSIIVTSNGTAHIVLHKIIKLHKNQQLFSNEGTAPMGYGLPAAIGAHYGSNKKIICIEGDGSIMMNLQELETIRHHNLPIQIFILNNCGYLSIRLTQTAFFNKQITASDFETGVSIPSFEKIAYAFGLNYHSIKNNNEIVSVLKNINKKKPSIIEVFTDPNELHEPKVSAKGIDSNGKIIPGELTDIK
jgi:acetolactate synthase I/II/III large subunit